MRKPRTSRLVCSLLLAGSIWLVGTGLARAQFTQNQGTSVRIDSSSFPPDIQKGYRLFREKCNECHGLDATLTVNLSAAQWGFEVNRMQAMASSQFNGKQAMAILAFLNYDEAHRKARSKPTVTELSSPAVSAGRQLYESQDCKLCHSIAGEGGTAGPDLTDVGNRLSRDQLKQLIQVVGSGKNPDMPHPPPHLTQEQMNSLVAYLASLKKH